MKLLSEYSAEKAQFGNFGEENRNITCTIEYLHSEVTVGRFSLICKNTCHFSQGEDMSYFGTKSIDLVDNILIIIVIMVIKVEMCIFSDFNVNACTSCCLA